MSRSQFISGKYLLCGFLCLEKVKFKILRTKERALAQASLGFPNWISWN